MTDQSSQSQQFQIDPYIRVKADKISQLLDLAGELGLAAAGVTNHPALAGLEIEGFQNDIHRLNNLVRDIQDQTSSLRLVPTAQLFRRMQRLARDLLIQTGKVFDFSIVGDEIELDKLLLDQLSEPLIHLIRNAADHGLETPEERLRSGKSERGRIQLIAEQRGREVLISVSDDGRGLDRGSILKSARKKGLVGEHEEISDENLWKVIFLPGFSTSEAVSNLSGRGVGMDVVQTTIQSLRGKVLVDTHPGQGTCITMAIPLTLAFLDCMVVKSTNRLYAIPIDVVNEVFSLADHQFIHSSAENSEMVKWHDEIIPIARFQDIFQKSAGESSSPDQGQIIVVVDTAIGQYGLPVEEIIGQQQVVLKPLKGVLQAIRGCAGCALLNSGEVAVALDVDRLLEKDNVA